MPFEMKHTWDEVSFEMKYTWDEVPFGTKCTRGCSGVLDEASFGMKCIFPFGMKCH